MAMPTDDQLTEALQPALDTYGAELDAHQHTYSGRPACTCGWQAQPTSRKPRNAVGLHIGAAQRRASRAYDAAAAEAMTALRTTMAAR